MGTALPVPSFAADAIEARLLDDGRPVILRPMDPTDASLLQAFVRGLSPAARRLRFQVGLRELNPALLATLTRNDRREHMAFAAVICEDGAETMVGESRYAPSVEHEGSSEFAVAVADDWRHKGLGTALADKLLRHARQCGIRRIYGDILRENAGMLQLVRRLGFSVRPHPDGAWLAQAVMDLDSPGNGGHPAGRGGVQPCLMAR